MKKSYIAAIAIAVLAILYFGLNALFGGEPEKLQTEPSSPQEDQAFSVVVRTLQADTRPGVLVLRGRTEAARTVSVRAETAGAVASAPATEGAQVKKGDILCRLSVQARRANLDQAIANRQARKLEWDAASTLEQKGHRSANQTAAAKASYDAAHAAVRQAEIELSNIKIRAPFNGVFKQRDAEIGDYLTPGQSCGVVAELDPLVITANVSELDVGKVATGMPGRAVLVSGQTLAGIVRYVDPVADNVTRTFRVELQVENPNGLFRAGLTTDMHLVGAPVTAQRIPADTMVLNDNGQLGVRVVDDTGHVRFFQVVLIEDEGDGMWVSGMPERANLIVEGQDFVRDGSLVNSVLDKLGSGP